MQTRKPRKGDVLELRLERLGARGESVGRTGDFVVSTRDAPPGASVRVQVLRRRRNAIDARVLEVVEPGPDQVAPRCAHFGTCGGCARQDLAYAAQLRELGRLLGELIAPLVDPDTRVDPVLGMEDPWHYRNKMDFTFGNRRWVEDHEPEGAERGFALGLHVRGRFEKVLDVQACDIAFREATPIVASARRLARATGLLAWDVREHVGLLRHLVLRKGVRTGEILVWLVTSPGEDEAVASYAGALVAAHPEITTLVHGRSERLATVAEASSQRVLHGPGVIHEELLGLRFAISPESFFQTNTVQAERLARIVREAVEVRPGAVVYDLYCGGGALSLAMAAVREGADAPAIRGFELVEAAVEDARANARANGIANARFVAGDLATTLAEASRRELDLEPPDACIVDPPRAGMHASVVQALGELAPGRLVHVSCNPKTAVHDLGLLCERGYRVRRVQPIDLFPHTPHLECVFTLEQRA